MKFSTSLVDEELTVMPIDNVYFDYSNRNNFRFISIDYWIYFHD